MGVFRKGFKAMFERGKYKIFRGDKVKVTVGKDAGQVGTVLRVIRDPRFPRVVVEGQNLVRSCCRMGERMLCNGMVSGSDNLGALKDPAGGALWQHQRSATVGVPNLRVLTSLIASPTAPLQNKRYIKRSKDNPGGVVSVESPIHYSNVALVDPVTDEAVRVVWRFLEDGTKVGRRKRLVQEGWSGEGWISGTHGGGGGGGETKAALVGNMRQRSSSLSGWLLCRQVQGLGALSGGA